MILSPSGGKSHLHLNRKMNPNWDFSSWNQQESNQVSAGVCLGIRQMNTAEDMHLHRFTRLILSMTILVHLLFPLLWIWKKNVRKWPSIWIFWNAFLSRYACSMMGSVDFSKRVHSIFWSHSPPLPSLAPCPSSLAFLLFPCSLPSASLILCLWTIPFHQAVYDSMHPFPSGCTTEENASPSPSVSVYKTSGSMGVGVHRPIPLPQSDAMVRSYRGNHGCCELKPSKTMSWLMSVFYPTFPPASGSYVFFFWPWFCDVPCTVGMEI